MSLQDIIKKILADTQDDLQAIESEAAEKKTALEKASVGIAAAEKKSLEGRAEEALTSVDEKTASMARRENAKSLQRVKRKLLDQAMEKFLNSLLTADDKLYTEVCDKLIAVLPFKKGTLLVPVAKETLMKKITTDFEIKPSSAVQGGFVAIAGDSEIDSTFESLVHSEYKSEIEMYLADQLKLV